MTDRIPQHGLDAEDRSILCSIICKCAWLPWLSKDGRSLKQHCVSARLSLYDKVRHHRSPYKAEFTFDMTKKPPQPFLDKVAETKSRRLWPGWTKSFWPRDPNRPVPYKPGRGYTRRPDVVIVKDPTRAPTQDNIKQVVEVKFPGDLYRAQQLEDYILIAGDEMKMVTLILSDCDCESSQRGRLKSTRE